MSSGSGTGETLQSAERRKIRRRTFRTQKTVLAEITGEGSPEQLRTYIFINDLSENGMKMTTNVLIPENNHIRLGLSMENRIEVEGRVAWGREVGRGNYVMGIELSSDSELNRVGIPRLIEWALPFEQKRSIRLSVTRSLDVQWEDGRKKSYAHFLMISPGGMEILHEAPFPEGRELTLTFSLTEKLPSITTCGRVLFQRKIPPLCDMDLIQDTHKIWISFQTPEIVQEHIQAAMDKGLIAPRE